MSDELTALHASAARLAARGRSMSEEDLTRSAFPTEWSVGNVFSHLGSSAVIFTHMFNDVVHQRDAEEGRNAAVWTEWNAKAPTAQVTECLEADAILFEHLQDLDQDRRAAFHFTMGPLAVDFEGFVGLRLNEHALHTWDIEEAFDAAATIPGDIAGVVVGNLRTATRFGAKPDGRPRHVAVATTDPARRFIVEIGDEGCDLVAGGDAEPDLTLPTEAFVRLVYGRCDAAHTPAGVEGDVIDGLRVVFRGL
jgi:uncharacterized protein (TIGR03083 family)